MDFFMDYILLNENNYMYASLARKGTDILFSKLTKEYKLMRTIFCQFSGFDNLSLLMTLISVSET